MAKQSPSVVAISYHRVSYRRDPTEGAPNGPRSGSGWAAAGRAAGDPPCGWSGRRWRAASRLWWRPLELEVSLVCPCRLCSWGAPRAWNRGATDRASGEPRAHPFSNWCVARGSGAPASRVKLVLYEAWPHLVGTTLRLGPPLVAPMRPRTVSGRCQCTAPRWHWRCSRSHLRRRTGQSVADPSALQPTLWPFLSAKACAWPHLACSGPSARCCDCSPAQRARSVPHLWTKHFQGSRDAARTIPPSQHASVCPRLSAVDECWSCTPWIWTLSACAALTISSVRAPATGAAWIALGCLSWNHWLHGHWLQSLLSSLALEDSASEQSPWS